MLALICGTGSLPKAVALAQKVPPLVCVLDGFAPRDLMADMTFRLEHLGSFLISLKNKGVREICLCGAVTRPDINPSQIDAQTMPLVPVLQAAMVQGDDGALRGVITILQDQGFIIRGATELAPDILPAAGVLTRMQPDIQAKADAKAALIALADMGRQDLGQACLVRDASVVAREDERGTDAMLADAAGDSNDATSSNAGLLFKAPKPGQDRRADLPTIGPDTALGVVNAGLKGIAIEAGGVIVLEQAKVVKILDDAGLFFWVRRP